MIELDIVISEGKARFIYTDEAAELLDQGESRITRASHVEPVDGLAIVDASGQRCTDGRWYADMSPSGGPMLAGFTTRNAALAAEVAWLKTNKGL